MMKQEKTTPVELELLDLIENYTDARISQAHGLDPAFGPAFWRVRIIAHVRQMTERTSQAVQ